MFGGFVSWEMGTKEDGSDSYAVQVAPRDAWGEMKAIILVVSDKKKGTPSTDGMQRTVATSELLQWRIKEVVPARMKVMEKAILERNFDSFAEETMRDSNQFHAVCLDTLPPISYLNDVSRAIIALVTEINRVSVAEEGRIKAAYTFDAGPNAVIYAVGQADVDAILDIVLRYFPQSPSSSSSDATATPSATKGLPKGFNEAVIPKFEVGSVSRIIHTQVGDGPRVLKQSESLLGVDGLPKSLV